MSKNRIATEQIFSCENYRPLHTSRSIYGTCLSLDKQNTTKCQKTNIPNLNPGSKAAKNYICQLQGHKHVMCGLATLTSFPLGHLQLRQEGKTLIVHNKLARWTRIQEVLTPCPKGRDINQQCQCHQASKKLFCRGLRKTMP